LSENIQAIYMKRNILILTFSFLVCAAAFGADYTTTSNINYRHGSNDKYVNSICLLDIAVPQGAKDAAVVVWFHGGGLEGGQKEIPAALKNGKLIIVGADYRRINKVDVDTIIDDAAGAVAWTVRNIKKYGGNPKKIFISGHSAGGYLVDMVALDKSRLAKWGIDADSLAGVVPFSGQVITHFANRKKMGMQPLQPLIDKTAPLYYVRPDCAPMLIISGDREQELYGRYEETAYFWRLMKLVGHKDVTMYELDGYNHGNMPEGGFPLLLRFINSHCK
jgi:acetyl esterase/lipase